MRLNPLKSAAITILGIASVPAIAQESSGFTFYGQLNQAFLSYDDGVDRIDYGRVDMSVNDQINRFGVNYDTDLSNGTAFRGTFEFGLAPKPSNRVSQLDQSNSTWEFDEKSLRKFEVSFANRFGTIWIGQGDMSGKGSAPDLSGTSVISSTNPAELAGGNFWRAEIDGSLTARPLNDSFTNFSTGRRFRLRYDTNSWNGLTFSASVGREVLTSGNNNTYIDAVGRYRGNWRQLDIAVELAVKGLGQGEYAGGGGFAILHKPSGFNLAASSLHATNDEHFGYAKVGFTRDVFSIGRTSISYDLYNSGNVGANLAESISKGFSIVQAVDAWNAEIYAIYRTYEGYNNVNNPAEEFLTSNATAFGIKWAF